MALITAPVKSYAHNGVDGIQDTLYHCMKDYKHGPNSRMSITFNSSKGLTNAPGQNNCFLNSAVQVLWHLDAFRRSFRLLSGHSCMGNACIFCALKVMFTQFQYSDKQVLPPDALRQALSETFQNQQRFQMGFMDDAAECFENILTRMHSHVASGENEDSCTAPHCIAHRKFSMSVSEQVVCGSCCAKSEPFTFNEMVFYVSTGALVAEFKSHSNEELSRLSFSQLLKNTVSKGDVRSCPENCGQFGEKRRDLTNIPDVVSIGLVWESAKSGSQHIRDVVNCIGTTLNLSEMFHSTPADNGEGVGNTPPLLPLQLVGVVCYYGKHYSTFFFHSKVHEWIYFDDAAVKQISPSWSKVCDKLCKGRHQPLLLLYMNPNTEALNVTSAPKFSTMAPGYEWKNEEHNEPINGVSKSSVPDSSSYLHPKASRRATAPERLDTRYDEVDEAYATRHFYKDKQSAHSDRYADRQIFTASTSSTALSRQDSGVSTHSSRSQPLSAVESDAASRISSVLTQHSTDSGSSGHQLTRQESDTGSSYCSRSSQASTVSTFSSAVESEDTGYAGLHSLTGAYQNESSPDKKKDKQKTSLKKKKMKNRLDADVMRYHSKSQASLLDVHNQSYDDSCPTRDNHHNIDTADQKSFSYATLPRKKRATPATQQHVAPVKSPEAALPPKGTNKADGVTQHTDTSSGLSVNSRIQMFNGIGDQPLTQNSVTGNKLPELKPLLHINGNEGTGESLSYISRSSVEKILNQQRKASSRTAMKMIRPTYKEQFVLPEEYTNGSENKRNDLRFDLTSDNTSLGSLKDSGYKSLGDRGSTSTSSVSSLSAESPTINQSFNFETREPIYCEPAPLKSDYDHIHQEELHTDYASDEFDFPPPPAELLGNQTSHSKQLSEASILSEASTLKQRKTPSVESLDTLPCYTDIGSDSMMDSLNNLSLADSKFKANLASAEEYFNRSLDREDRNELSTSLAFCRQAVNLLNSVLSQRPESNHLVNIIQTKRDYCSNRAEGLLSRIVCDSEDGSDLSTPTTSTSNVNGGQPTRHVMAELHIDNQTKRGAASSDYTPLHNAIHRAPAATREPNKSHRLSRTDSQTSNTSSSASSTGRTTSTRSQQSTNSPRTIVNGDSGSSERTVHKVPPQLQYSISQLQKQQNQQNQQLQQNQQIYTQHQPQVVQAQPPPLQQPQPPPKPSNQRGFQQDQTHHPSTQFQALRSHSQQQTFSRQSSSSSGSQYADSDTRLETKSEVPKSSHTLYREVNIPTTLQRNDYIRDGYRATPADRRACSSPSPSVIPPPKEFQEVSASRNGAVTSTSDPYNNLHTVRSSGNYPHKTTASMYSSTSNYSNGVINSQNAVKSQDNQQAASTQGQSVHTQPTPYARQTSGSSATHDNYRDLPAKQNINKQNIREMLVKDMLKRQGQPNVEVPRTSSNNYHLSNVGHSNLPTYSPQFEEPLWSPPQQSAYDRGLSHYDRPNYQRQNLYGQVNSKPTANEYPVNSQPSKSLYGENTLDTRQAFRHNNGIGESSRINHSHTYSTEL